MLLVKLQNFIAKPVLKPYRQWKKLKKKTKTLTFFSKCCTGKEINFRNETHFFKSICRIFETYFTEKNLRLSWETVKVFESFLQKILSNTRYNKDLLREIQSVQSYTINQWDSAEKANYKQSISVLPHSGDCRLIFKNK